MKKIFTWATALTMSFALFSCEKENKDISSSPSDKQEQVQQEDNLTRTLYTATSEIGNYDVSQVKEDEELRANVICKGYRKPDINISFQEFENKIKSYWVILGEQTNTSGTINRYRTTVPSPNNPPTENTLSIRTENNKLKLRMYAQVEDSFDVTNKFSMLALDGTLRDDRYLDFTGSTDPNTPIITQVKATGEEQYHLPIMTDIMPFKKVFKEKNIVHYKPRGVMLAISVINNDCSTININKIEFENNNALWFEGSFDTWTADDGTDTGLNVKAISSSGVNTSYKAKFIGSRGNEDISYTIKGGATAGYRIDRELGQTINSAIKEAATKFYIWGYPRDKNKKLKFKITYNRNWRVQIIERECTIEQPSGGFQDGYVYQLPILISDEAVDNRRAASLGFTTPLDFVAEGPAINKAGTGFVQYYKLPTTDVVADMKDSEVGYYNWQQAKDLFNGTNSFLANYYLPTTAQWRSIVPYDSQRYINFIRVQAKQTLTEPAQIGENPEEVYTSEYKTVQEPCKYVTYAIRFKGTKWESAWRYSYPTTGRIYMNRRIMLVKCVPLKGKTGITLDKITNPEFFIKNPCTIRTFPNYGFNHFDTTTNSYETNARAVGTTGEYWAADHRNSLHLLINAYIGTARVAESGCAVRPFQKQP